MNETPKIRGGAHVAGKHTAQPREKQPREKTPRPESGKSPAGKIALLVLAVLLVGFCCFTGYDLYLNEKIYPGVTMGQAALGGMDRGQARKALEEAYGDADIDQSIQITVEERSFTIPVRDAGLSYDIPQSVERAYAYGREGGFGARFTAVWRARLKKAHLALSTQLDESALEARVQDIAPQVAQPLSPSAYSYENGVLTLDKGQEGYSLDAEALVSALRDKLEQADFTPVAGTLRRSQPEALSAQDIAQEVNREGTEPSLDLENDPTGRTVTPGTEGVEVSAAAIQAAIDSPDRITTVQCTVTQPKYTAAEYKALLFRDVLGEYSSSFNAGNVGRTTNVLLATDFCNGVILRPGDIFSYNNAVGPRTYERGFKDAIVYVGATAEDGVGGGICQVSSTLYAAALRADLKIVERYAHSRLVTYVPLGEDATVAWGSKDFRFQNDTDFPIKVVTSHQTSSLTVRIYGTKVQNKTVKMVTETLSKTPFEVEYVEDASLAPGTEKVTSNGYTGYQTKTWRVVYVDGVETSRTLENTSTYKKYNKVIHRNTQSAPASGGTTSGGTGETGSGAETGGNEGGSTAPVFPETPNTEPGGLD